MKRFHTGGPAHNNPHDLTYNPNTATVTGGGSSSNKFSLKSFMGDNAAALIGGGLGALFGTSGGSDGKNPSGYQGGIPDYVYNPTLKDNAFANTYQKEVPVTEWYTNPAGMLDQRNVPGATTSVTAPRRPGSMGRSYFDYPTTGGLYSPVTTTDAATGITTNNVMGGEYLANTSAAAEKARADQLAYNQQIGQAYIDAYGENYASGSTNEGSSVTGSLGSGSVTGSIGSGVTGSIGSGVTGSGSGSDSGSVTVDTLPNIGGTASTIGSAPTLGGITTLTETPAVAASVAPGSTSATTTGGTSDLYNYLSGMGFGETARNITADDIAAFGRQSVFSLGDIATALGTDPTALLSVANYTAPTALQTALADLDFDVEGGKTITKGDITSLTTAGYALEDIAAALGVEATDLTSISAYEAPSDTTVALNTALSNMGFSTDASQTITKQHITDLTGGDNNFTLDQIATALGVEATDLTSIVDYTAPTDLQTALVGLGFTADGQTITADHIATLTGGNNNFTLDQIAEALNVDIADLAAISGYTTPTGLQTALADLDFDVEGGKVITAGDISTLTGGNNNFTLDQIAEALDVGIADLAAISGYEAPTGLQTALAALDFDAVGGKTITKGDISTLTQAPNNFTLADIAIALDVSVSDLNSISSYTLPTALQTALSGMGFSADASQTITKQHISDLTGGNNNFTLEQIAEALDVTTDQLNSISSYTAPIGLEAALEDLDFDVEGGKVITAGDITSLTDADYTLAEIATALNVTEDQLNSISSYTSPTALQTALADLDFDVEGGKVITAGDISTLTQAPNNFTLADIATALNVTEDQLNSISSYTAPEGLAADLIALGYGVDGGQTITAHHISQLITADYTLAEIATALNVTEAQLNSISSYSAPIGLEAALVTLGFDADDGKVITAGDITSLTAADYTLAEIATALNVTEDQLNSISSYTSPTGLETALSTLGYAVEGGKVITAGDISTLTGADYGFTLAEIATALNVTETQLNSVVSYEAPSDTAIALNSYLVGMGYSDEDKDITKADVEAWQDQDTYTLAAIADALGTTEAILISISNASAAGGLLEGNQGYYLGGPTDGMADNVPATIDGAEPARLSDGEFVVPADVVSHLGNGNSEAGSEQLYSMMDRVRQERTGTTRQGAQINPMQQLPA